MLGRREYRALQCRPARWVASHRTTQARYKGNQSVLNVSITHIHFKDLRRGEPRPRLDTFFGDIGAPRSLIGIKELRRVLGTKKLQLPRHGKLFSQTRFMIADASLISLGRTVLPPATASGTKPILVELDVLNADIHALLGMDVLEL